MGYYSDLATAIEEVFAKTAAPETDISGITKLLQMSAGRLKSDPNAIEYRPYYASAVYLQQSRRDQLIAQEEQTRFTGLATPIASLLALQAALDQELIVPLGFEAQAPAQKAVTGNQLELLKDGYEAALLTLKKYLPRP